MQNTGRPVFATGTVVDVAWASHGAEVGEISALGGYALRTLPRCPGTVTDQSCT